MRAPDAHSALIDYPLPSAHSARLYSSASATSLPVSLDSPTSHNKTGGRRNYPQQHTANTATEYDLNDFDDEIKKEDEEWSLTKDSSIEVGQNSNNADVDDLFSDSNFDEQLSLQIEKELGLNEQQTNRKNAWGNLSYAELIAKAIENSQQKRLTLAQIYTWMVKYVPYFRDKGDRKSSSGWKNSIRHNLSLHNRFVRVPNEIAGKSSWWTVDPRAKQVRGRRRIQSSECSTTTTITKPNIDRRRVQTAKSTSSVTTPVTQDFTTPTSGFDAIDELYLFSDGGTSPVPSSSSDHLLNSTFDNQNLDQFDTYLLMPFEATHLDLSKTSENTLLECSSSTNRSQWLTSGNRQIRKTLSDSSANGNNYISLSTSYLDRALQQNTQQQRPSPQVQKLTSVRDMNRSLYNLLESSSQNDDQNNLFQPSPKQKVVQQQPPTMPQQQQPTQQNGKILHEMLSSALTPPTCTSDPNCCTLSTSSGSSSGYSGKIFIHKILNLNCSTYIISVFFVAGIDSNRSSSTSYLTKSPFSDMQSPSSSLIDTPSSLSPPYAQQSKPPPPSVIEKVLKSEPLTPSDMVLTNGLEHLTSEHLQKLMNIDRSNPLFRRLLVALLRHKMINNRQQSTQEPIMDLQSIKKELDNYLTSQHNCFQSTTPFKSEPMDHNHQQHNPFQQPIMTQPPSSTNMTPLIRHDLLSQQQQPSSMEIELLPQQNELDCDVETILNFERNTFGDCSFDITDLPNL
ncbi:unnamed protein product [Didymodactylos carnosus]|uniref:Fork-head domain-containing protein n=1 Tax=Didymodactylos carnosus TaxID=1234261 RepID=A0A814FAN7_9BILA|nr:unnamed protein product [Didymodactylos carnosus]CAF1118466.1 unnamed protein product [Didymodactylos carnosus]CAF3754996.1 unnamed protein product [Didymodactylos carnosus]CAF3890535.1 unnamed protein product [Didymodactylos carnosus]